MTRTWRSPTHVTGAVSLAVLITIIFTVFTPATLAAYGNSVTYGGQGLLADGFGGFDLRTEICGVANGADVDGPYLLWVLTATGAAHADITGPWGTAPMTKTGNGTFKYISGWYAPSTLLYPIVVATYDGKAKNAQLTVSHGCRPYLEGAWCSPGFWRNATDAAWALAGYDRDVDLFNNTVYSFWFGATEPADPTLQTVLDNPQIYSGPANTGTSGYPLNAFNATGAMLTDHIPGFTFDFSVMELGSSTACPIDHFGHFK
jgi:hypothetical protein